MKLTIVPTILALVATTLLSRSNAEDATKASNKLTYALKLDQTTVAILPANKDITTEVTSDSAHFNKNTGIQKFTGGAKIVITIPGKSPITISGNELTLVPQK